MLMECYKQVLKNWFGTEENERKFIDRVMEILNEKWNDKNIFVIEAPTGYGKSTISATVSLFSLKSEDCLKCIVAFPLRTLLEDQYNKFVEDEIKEIDGRKYEKTSILGKVDYNLRVNVIGKRYMHNPDSRYLIKPITLTTVDTLSLTLFGIPPECMDKVVKAWDGTIGGSLGHYIFSWGSVVFSNIVLDEVHLLADSTKSLSFLIALMKIARDFNQRLILMSATLPNALKSVLRRHFPNEIELVEFEIDDDPKFYRDRIEKKYDVVLESVTDQDKFEKIVSWLKENKEFTRVIVMFNTVQEAVNFYNERNDELKTIFGDVILLHSRFSEEDRMKKIGKIQSLKDKYLIISTQVIEAGVDISSNLFITDLAPANSLIQRLGRFLRYPNEDKGRVIVWYEVDENGRLKANGKAYKVYDYDLTEKTLEWLIKNSLDDKENKRYVRLNVHLPEVKENSKKKGYKELLDHVYESFNVDEDAIRDFEGIFLHLENASLVAIEKFFEMEGSFVRDELQIPVVSKKRIDELRGDEKPINFVRKHVIPISFESFRKIRGKVDGAILEEEKPKFVAKDEDDWLRSILERRGVQPRDMLKYIFANDVLAFVVEAEYDEKTGLRFDRNGGLCVL